MSNSISNSLDPMELPSKLSCNKIVHDQPKFDNWTFDEILARENICRMMIRDDMPFNLVEGDGMVDAFFVAQPLLHMPSYSTVKRDCRSLYLKEREKLKVLFETSCISVCVTTNGWTSVSMDPYICITAHWIDNDWKLQKKVINILATSHKGTDIANALDHSLSWWGLSKKLLTVTVDDASANDVACGLMKEIAMNNGCIGSENFRHVRCIAHIINLVVRVGLQEEGDHLTKVRTVVRWCKGSTTRRRQFRELAEMHGIVYRGALRNDVPTRWISTFMMLNGVLKYKRVFARMQIPSDDQVEPMDSSDWKRVETLCHFLREFYLLTKRMSGSLYVTSNFLIYHVATVSNLLQDMIVGDDDELQRVARKMKSEFDKYFDHFERINLLLFVPAILDPQRKMEGVTNVLMNMFPEEDVDFLVKRVKDFAYELFDEFRYKYSSVSQSKDVVAGKDASWMSRYSAKSKNLKSEFDQYLVETEWEESTNKNVLEWWRDRQKRYPILAYMARAMLAIPISAVSSESIFSTVGRTISAGSNLSAEMIQTIVCTQNWLPKGKDKKVPKDDFIEDEILIEDDWDSDDSNDLTEGTFYVCSR